MGVAEGQEWEPLAGLGGNARPGVEALLERSRDRARKARARLRHGRRPRTPRADRRRAIDPGGVRPDPARPRRSPAAILADRIVTTSPDVTVSTNLGAWVNQRGLFKRREMAGRFRPGKNCVGAKMVGAQSRASTSSSASPRIQSFPDAGRARGCPATCSASGCFPIGTLYDPFIARGLDSLNYACYQDARFLLVATPCGITLGPEGGAHQSINPPLIALGQPGLRHYEPAFADELAAMMEEAFRLIDDPARRKSTYLRLSTRIDRPGRARRRQLAGRRAAGGYWLREPGAECRGGDRRDGRGHARGARAHGRSCRPTSPGLGLLAVTSPDLLHRGWTAAQAARWAGRARAEPCRDSCCRGWRRTPVSSPCADAAPASLSWLGGVLGQRVAPLGVDRFGQTGNLADLYAAYRLDGEAITEAIAELLLRRLGDAPWPDAFSTSGRSATRSRMPSPAPSPRPTMS